MRKYENMVTNLNQGIENDELNKAFKSSSVVVWTEKKLKNKL